LPISKSAAVGVWSDVVEGESEGHARNSPINDITVTSKLLTMYHKCGTIYLWTVNLV